MDDLLSFYGLPANGTNDAKRNILRVHLGITILRPSAVHKAVHTVSVTAPRVMATVSLVDSLVISKGPRRGVTSFRSLPCFL